MDSDERGRIVEALLLASPEPLTAQRLAALLPDGSARAVREQIDALNQAYDAQGRAFRIEEVAGGYQLRTRPEYASWLQKLRPQPPLRLSRAALETLAIVAYKQPVTRAELEHVRGVDVGAVLAGLLERHLVRIAGHREVPGRPMLYATTRRFLEVFGLPSLADLPTLREVEELLRDRARAIESEAGAPGIGEPGAGAALGNAAMDRDDEASDEDADAGEDPSVPTGPGSSATH
jgi:segregation and condensation protein B